MLITPIPIKNVNKTVTQKYVCGNNTVTLKYVNGINTVTRKYVNGLLTPLPGNMLS